MWLRRRPCVPLRRARLGVEVLEDRLTPTTSVTVFTSDNTFNPGQSLQATASVKDVTIGGSVPIVVGKLTFTIDGGSPVVRRMEGTNGTVSITIGSAGLSLGSHTVRASYTEGFFFGDDSDTDDFALAVPTVTTIFPVTHQSRPASSFPLGSQVTFQARVQPLGPGLSAMGGNLQFIVDGQFLTQVPVQPTGLATLSTAGLTVGTHQIRAFFNGFSHPFAGFVAQDSFSATTITVTVTPATSTTTLTTSAQVLPFGQEATFQAVVGVPAGQPVPTGTVTFTVGSNQQAVPLVNGTAAFTGVVPPGQQTVTATYSGNANYLTSTGSIVETVGLAPATPTLEAESPAGGGLTLTATVPGVVFAGQNVTPQGTITFLDGDVVVAALDLRNGQASLHLATLTPGPHSFSARYSGDGFFDAANTAALALDGGPVPELVPAGPRDVTDSVGVTPGKVKRFKGFFAQTVTLKNQGATPIDGPIVLVLRGLPRRIKLRAGRGVARRTRVAGDANAVLVLPEGVGFQPGESVTLKVAFGAQPGRRLKFTPQVLAGFPNEPDA